MIEILWLSLFYYSRKCLALPPSRPIGGKEGVSRWGGCCSVVFFQQPKLSNYGIVEMPWLSLFTSKENAWLSTKWANRWQRGGGPVGWHDHNKPCLINLRKEAREAQSWEDFLQKGTTIAHYINSFTFPRQAIIQNGRWHSWSNLHWTSWRLA